MPNTAKQEDIRKAYEAIGQKPHYKHTDDNGWTAMYSEDGEKLTPCFKDLGFTQQQVAELLDSGLNSDTGKMEWRPKSLQGIETNNGWIRIESEENFPTENSGLYFVYDGKDVGIARMSTILFRCLTSNEVYSDVTHYQPIVKPEKPIY